jgi:hypothetical protein
MHACTAAAQTINFINRFRKHFAIGLEYEMDLNEPTTRLIRYCQSFSSPFLLFLAAFFQFSGLLLLLLLVLLASSIITIKRALHN